MSNLNQITISGNLTADATMKYLPSKTAVVNFSLASNRTYRDSAGNKQNEATFVDCNVFGKYAEAVHKLLKKGSHVTVCGRLKFRTWTNTAGTVIRKHEIDVQNCSDFRDKYTGNGQPEAAGSTETTEEAAPVGAPADFEFGDDSPL